MKADAAGRREEPELRELTAELDGTRELLLSKIADLKELAESKREADLRLVLSKFDAMAVAGEKSDANLEKWRAQANEWRDAMNDREAEFARKVELESLKEKVETLRIAQSMGGGVISGREAVQGVNRANLMAVVSVVGLIALWIWNLTQGR